MSSTSPTSNDGTSKTGAGVSAAGSYTDSDIAGGSTIGTASMGTSATSGAASSSLKSNLGQAGSHLKQAASHAGVSLKGAASAAGDELRLGKAQVKSELADSALSGIAAAEQAAAASREQMDVLMDKGRDLIDSASELIRERPLVSFGVAFATGWVIAKLARSGDK